MGLACESKNEALSLFYSCFVQHHVTYGKTMHLESCRSKCPINRDVAMLPSLCCTEMFPDVVMLLTTASMYDLWFVLAPCIWISQATIGATVIQQLGSVCKGLIQTEGSVCKGPLGTWHIPNFCQLHPLLQEPMPLFLLPLKCPLVLSTICLRQHNSVFCALLEIGSVLTGSDLLVGGGE